MGEMLFSIETRINRWKIEFKDQFAHLAELEVLKYLSIFPHWSTASQFMYSKNVNKRSFWSKYKHERKFDSVSIGT